MGVGLWLERVLRRDGACAGASDTDGCGKNATAATRADGRAEPRERLLGVEREHDGEPRSQRGESEPSDSLRRLLRAAELPSVRHRRCGHAQWRVQMAQG